jgi:formate dehydrogenase subunit gamma
MREPPVRGGELQPVRRRPPSAFADPGAPLARFDRVERVVHWTNATLFAVLIFTGAVLYFGPLTAVIGRRELVERIHVYVGLALPVPILLASAGSWGRGLRADLRRWNRFSPADRSWLRAVGDNRRRRERVRSELPIGKFNAGQKLNAAFVGGAGLVMLGTGVILRWYRPWPLSWRAGATFVHNWLALLIIVAIAGHIFKALSDWDALRSIFGGSISRTWARRHAPAWLEEIEAGERAATPVTVSRGTAGRGTAGRGTAGRGTVGRGTAGRGTVGPVAADPLVAGPSSEDGPPED